MSVPIDCGHSLLIQMFPATTARIPDWDAQATFIRDLCMQLVMSMGEGVFNIKVEKFSLMSKGRH